MNFEDQRTQLFGIAYRMLGSVMDAEDVVQDAWLRYQRMDTQPEHPAAYLRTVVTNLSLDRLKSARVQREQYIGEWLPEPLRTAEGNPADDVQRAESVSMALLVVLESLSPLERAVFILREVFDYDYADIARMLDRSEATCRKHLSRARSHVQAARSRFDVSAEAHDRLVTQFIDAVQQGDIQGVVSLLADDATLTSDGGGVVTAATRPVLGRERIGAFLAGLYAKAQRDGLTITVEAVQLNGQTGLLMRDAAGQVTLAATFEVGAGTITTLRLVRNPAKLRRL